MATTSAPERVPELAAVYGGGASFAIAFGMGIAEALVDAGVALPQAPAVGTSGGSWAAGCTALGVPYAAVAALPRLTVPDRRPGRLRELAGELFGTRRAPQVCAVAFHPRRRRRVLLCAGEHDLADVVAASSSIPGAFRAAVVDGERYVDGGMRSWVSAELAPAARRLLVVAPVGSPLLGTFGRMLNAMLRREVARWQDQTGGEAVVVRPVPSISRLIGSRRDLFDQDLAVEVHARAREQGARLVAQRPDLVARLDVV